MEKIWRFFDNTHCISGIVVAESKIEAMDRTVKYLIGHFSDITHEESLDVCVWEIEYDDDYNKKFPYVVATSY